jgi:hypothetical protein
VKWIVTQHAIDRAKERLGINSATAVKSLADTCTVADERLSYDALKWFRNGRHPVRNYMKILVNVYRNAILLVQFTGVRCKVISATRLSLVRPPNVTQEYIKRVALDGKYTKDS